MSVEGAKEEIINTVSRWEGVSAVPHRFGGTEFRLRTREIGHIHGGYLVDIPFPTRVRNQLVSAGEVSPHHILPDSGWVSFYIQQASDIEVAINLLRKSYQIAAKQRIQSNANTVQGMKPHL